MTTAFQTKVLLYDLVSEMLQFNNKLWLHKVDSINKLYYNFNNDKINHRIYEGCIIIYATIR
jgi:hypothetical protein